MIRHFAGDVCYETEHFLTKNNDTIHTELLEVLCGSTHPFVEELFPEEFEGFGNDDAQVGPTGGRFMSIAM